MNRPFAISIDAIKERLLPHLDSLVPSLFPNARRAGNEWIMGDLHGAPGRAVSINRRTGWMKDFRYAKGAGGGGDILTVIAAGACDGDVKAAIPWALNYLNLGHLSEEERRRAEDQARRSRAKREAEHAADSGRIRRAARGHWHGAVPIAGTPADRYLLGRGIDIRRIPAGRASQASQPDRVGPGSLRFKPMRCPEFSEPNAPLMRPCMIACVNHPITGEMLAIHRTFLHVHGDGRVTQAREKDGGPMQQAKRALGDYAGGFIPLARGASGRPLSDAPEGEALVLSEGIEDGLSVALALPELRVGAALSLSNLGGVLAPTRLGGFGIAGQNDTKAEAIAALASARRRLEERGVMHRLVLPPDGIKDWNDWLLAIETPAAADLAQGAA